MALADTVSRVGKDTIRKLGSNDRIIGALKLCEKYGVDCSYLAIGVACGLNFAPSGDDSSKVLYDYASQNGVKEALIKYSDYQGKYVDLISSVYDMVKNGKTILEIIKYCDASREKEIKV